MAKESKSHRTSNLKYKKNGAHQIVIQFTNKSYEKLYAYCQHIKSPVATWIKGVIWKAIDEDESFSYDDGNGNEDS